MTPLAGLAAALAPTGKLRAAINLGNPILARLDPATRRAAGVSVDLAHALAKRLALEIELVVVDAAATSVERVLAEVADVGFFAVDPKRAEGIAFTAPYVLIEGCYLVREDSPVRVNEDVDRAGRSVVVGQGSAYDLFLSRELRHARLVRSPTSPTVVATFVDQGADVAAGVRQQLEADAAARGGLRLLDGRFMLIQQAMGIRATRGALAIDGLRAFVEEMKASGFVEQALARHGIAGASVAGPAS
jgi:polar amino acid transport system substrate-binding protein